MDRAGADEDSSDDAQPRKSVFSSCVVSAAIDLSAEDQEQVAQAIAMVAHHAIANKVTDVEGAISLLGSVPEDVAEALGRFGAKVVDKLPADLRLQMEKQLRLTTPHHRLDERGNHGAETVSTGREKGSTR